MPSLHQPRLPSQNELVEVRHRCSVVADVALNLLPQSSGLVAYPFQRQHVVTLSSMEDALGEELQVIWKIEPWEVSHMQEEREAHHLLQKEQLYSIMGMSLASTISHT